MTQVACKLPNLVIAGVHKAGTTSLYSYLSKHPDICPSFKKEIGYFLPLMFGREPAPIDEYAGYFEHCGNESFRLDASPSYFYGNQDIAAAMSEVLPDAKVILVLRDPTDRLVSFFSRAVSKSTLPADIKFDEYLAISETKVDSDEYSVYTRGVREGIYADYIEPWQESFGDSLKIVFFDDLKKNALDLTQSICSWLGLPIDCYSPQDFTIENKTLQYKNRGLHRYVKDMYMKNEVFWRKHHWLKQRFRVVYNALNADKSGGLKTIDEASVARLRDYYAPHNMRLRSFLVVNGYSDLPEWLA